MSLKFHEMRALVQEIKPILEGAVILEISAIKERTFLFHFKNHVPSLLLCFQTPFLRFHLVQRKTTSDSFHSSSFLKQVSHRLQCSVLKSINLLNEDRILELTFKKNDQTLFVISEFFPKSPNCYFLDDRLQLLSSLNPTSKIEYALPSKAVAPASSSLLSSITSLEIEQRYDEQERTQEFAKKKHDLEAEIKRKIQSLEKKRAHVRDQLALCKNWRSVQHEGELLQANLYRLKKGMEKVLILDWEKENQEVTLSLNPKSEPTKEAAKRFEKSKKLQLGIPHHEAQLNKVELEISSLKDLLLSLAAINQLEELENFQKRAVPTKIKALPVKNPVYREFISKAGLKIWVGRNANQNHRLTFSMAHGSDFWLHAHHFSGSHVILRVGKNQVPDEESLQDAIQLALYYSKAKEKKEADVCITQRKYVSPLGKDKKGKVQISKHRLVHATLDRTRLQQIFIFEEYHDTHGHLS